MIEVQTEVTAIDPGMTVHPLVGERAGQGVPEGMTTGIKTEIADMVVVSLDLFLLFIVIYSIS